MVFLGDVIKVWLLNVLMTRTSKLSYEVLLAELKEDYSNMSSLLRIKVRNKIGYFV